LVDHPDGLRKTHSKSTPVAGGLAVLLASSLTIGGALLLPSPLREPLTKHSSDLLGLLIASLVICGVGLLDDCGRLRGRHKLAGQIIASGIVMGFGLIVRQVRVFDWTIDLGICAVPFTLLILLGAINSLNLMDGLDGLLSTLGVIIALGIGGMAVLGGHWEAAAVAFAMAGALLGFLRYNYPPASIFLGDTGSMLIGLVVGVLAIRSSLKAPATVALAAPLAALTIPILDTTAAILRRKLTGRSIYTTDRGHIHHCLLTRGLSNQLVLLSISLFCLLTVLGALASLAINNELVAILTALVMISVLVGVRLFGHAEFLLAKERLFGAARSFMQSQPNQMPRAVEVRLQGSANWEELWGSILARARDLNLLSVSLDVNAPVVHEGYHARWDRRNDEAEGTSHWSATMPLQMRGQAVGRLVVSGYRDGTQIWKKIAALTRLVQKLEERMALLLENLDDGAPWPLTARAAFDAAQEQVIAKPQGRHPIASVWPGKG
jgi:UDP-GlcNAc:undecaprenyl-phosphate GlcNAc-1-phosphate transferase